MELDFSMLAVGAEAGANGKLHIFGGGFDSMEVSELPGVVAPFTLISRFTDRNVVGQQSHTFGLAGVNPDGEVTTLVEGLEFKFAEPTTKDRDTSHAMVLVQVGLKVRSPGCHQFVVSVDGRELKKLELWITVSADKTTEI